MNPAYGGPPHGIRASIKAMETMGVENEVVCCDSPNSNWVGRDSFPVHALGPGWFGISYTLSLSPWIKKNASHFDAVILHGMWQWPGVALLKSSVTRFFLMPHGMLDPWFQRDASRRVKAVRNFFYWWLIERQVVNNASGVLFTCEEEMLLARTTFGGYHPRKELTVGYGFAAAPKFSEKMRSAFSEKFPFLTKRPYILFLGRIHPKKGLDLLIRAYSEITKIEKNKPGLPDLVIAGPGWESAYGKQMRQEIDTANAALPAENFPCIHSIGMLEGDAKWGALHGCEAFILPSHQENFGIAVVEALSCNKPVLISNKVNIWREILEDEAGLIEEDSFAGTLRLLRRFFSGELLKENKERFRDCFHRRFEIQNASQNLIKALLIK
ncbi:MAG: glycosyltransferase [Spartobacteria bacterium]